MIWPLPIGGAAGIVGVPLPGTEIIIALSVIVLGGMVAMAARLNLVLALVIVGVFAFAHGHAHGSEMPGRSPSVPASSLQQACSTLCY